MNGSPNNEPGETITLLPVVLDSMFNVSGVFF